jgi:hypothetical protein
VSFLCVDFSLLCRKTLLKNSDLTWAALKLLVASSKIQMYLMKLFKAAGG